MSQSSEITSTLYVIGDVHGHLDVLRKMLDFIRQDCSERDAPPAVYFIGDLVDRGPDSKGVVSQVIETLAEFPGSKLHLGNHDDWLMRTLDDLIDFGEFAIWLDPRNGGRSTLKSYFDGEDSEAVKHIRANHPDHADLLRNASLYTQHGGFVFAHAGIIREIPMKDQDKETLIWIREGFLDSRKNDGRLVIHGHTPIVHGQPEVAGNRINIDTGVFRTGILTCMVLDPVERSIGFYQTADEADSFRRVDPKLVNDTESARSVLEAPFSFSAMPDLDAPE